MRYIKSHLADFLTVCNGLAGFLALMYILDGGLANFIIAAQLILIGMLLDGLDGITARAFKTQHAFGRKLDAICDVVTFCFAPGFLLYGRYYNPDHTSIQLVDNAFVVASVLLICGLGTLRLARSSNGNRSQGHFNGLPTSYVAYLSIGITFTVSEPMYMFLVVAFLSILMHLEIRFLKPRGLLTFVFFLFVVAMIWTLTNWDSNPNNYLLRFLLLSSGLYLLSPLLIGRHVNGDNVSTHV